jgi:hypothetical protein
MRFEAGAAIAIGFLLPVLETLRRGLSYWGVEFTTMLEDYLAGALLLCAALAARKARPYAPPLLLLAWAAVASMMTISLVSQLEESFRGADLEPHNGIVVGFKVLLWSTCMISLVRSFQRVAHERR